MAVAGRTYLDSGSCSKLFLFMLFGALLGLFCNGDSGGEGISVDDEALLPFLERVEKIFLKNPCFLGSTTGEGWKIGTSGNAYSSCLTGSLTDACEGRGGTLFSLSAVAIARLLLLRERERRKVVKTGSLSSGGGNKSLESTSSTGSE